LVFNLPCNVLLRKSAAVNVIISERYTVRVVRVVKLSKARLQSSKHTGAKQNLTQNGHSRSFNGKCFGVNGKAIMN